MRSTAHFLIAGLLFTASSVFSFAAVSLPAVFSDGMVLQRDIPIPVWGWASPGESVSISFGTQNKTIEADDQGNWKTRLDPLTTNATAQKLIVKADNELTIHNILVGEVWLCSGQSNMAMRVQAAKDAPLEIAAANYPLIRVFTESSRAAEEPQKDGKGTWQTCSPQTVAAFSATAYYFGRELHRELNVPIGLINSSVGGTPIEAWISLPTQKDVPQLKFIFEDWQQRIASWNPVAAQQRHEKLMAAWKTRQAEAKTNGTKAPVRPRPPVDPKLDGDRPANLFNGKINPLAPFAIRGAIWYQGESNSSTAQRGLAYQVQLPLLVADWRQLWQQGDFPFAWVQLPNFDRAPSGWSYVQEAMLKSLAIKNTGMVTTLGLGEALDIHPKNKQDIGKRLAMWALSTSYGRHVEWSGPLYASHTIKGSEVEVQFTHADGLASSEDSLKGFVIAGEDQQWKPASARIEGSNVILSNLEVTRPVAVRYAWGPNPQYTLVNSAKLPASPFRTDDFAPPPEPEIPIRRALRPARAKAPAATRATTKQSEATSEFAAPATSPAVNH